MEGLFSFTTEFCRWGGTLLQVWYPIPKWNYQWSKQKQEKANSANDCNESLMWFISFGWSQSVFATPSISAIIQQCHLVSQLGISNKSNARYQMRLAREVDCLRMAYFQLVIKKWKKNLHYHSSTIYISIQKRECSLDITFIVQDLKL